MLWLFKVFLYFHTNCEIICSSSVKNTIGSLMKVKSLSCVQLFCDPVDCSPPGSSVHGILQARIMEWVAKSLLQGIFLTQGSNPGLLHRRRVLCRLSPQGSPSQTVMCCSSLVLGAEVPEGTEFCLFCSLLQPRICNSVWLVVFLVNTC